MVVFSCLIVVAGVAGRQSDLALGPGRRGCVALSRPSVACFVLLAVHYLLCEVYSTLSQLVKYAHCLVSNRRERLLLEVPYLGHKQPYATGLQVIIAYAIVKVVSSVRVEANAAIVAPRRPCFYPVSRGTRLGSVSIALADKGHASVRSCLQR